MNTFEDKDSTIYCKNCKRDIPVQNFQIHEPHCFSKVRLCSKCVEPIPKAEMEEHMEKYHVLVQCKCTAKVEKSQLDFHEKNDCPHRMIRCMFCEMDLKYLDMFDHKEACGSKTEKCSNCGKYVMLKNLDTHVCNSSLSAHQHLQENRRMGYDNHQDGVSDEFFDSSFTITADASMRQLIPDYVSNFLGNIEANSESFPVDQSTRLKPCERNPVSKEQSLKNSRSKTDGELGFRKPRRSKKNLGVAGRVPSKITDTEEHVSKDLKDLDLDDRSSMKNEHLPRRQRKSPKVPFENDKMKHSHITTTRKVVNDDMTVSSGFAGFGISGKGLAVGQLPKKKVFADGTAIDLEKDEKPSKLSLNNRNIDKNNKPTFKSTKATGTAAQFVHPMDIEVSHCDEKTNKEIKKQIEIEDDNCELPCELCDLLFPIDSLQIHQEYCLQSQQDALTNYRNPNCKLETTKTEACMYQTYYDSKPENSLSSEQLSIPCEFCQEAFSFESIFQHQVSNNEIIGNVDFHEEPYCDMNPQKHTADDSMDLCRNRSDVPSGWNLLHGQNWASGEMVDSDHDESID